MLICRFGIDEKRKTTLSQMRLQSRWDRVFFLFSSTPNLQIRTFFDTADIRINEHGVIRMINDVSWLCLWWFF